VHGIWSFRNTCQVDVPRFFFPVKQQIKFKEMTKKQNSSQSNNSQDKRELTQTIIDEMKAQGFLEDFIDKETGEALFEIQFSDRSMVCKVENAGKDD
jgi:glutamine synthetase